MANEKNLFEQYRKDRGLRQKDVAEYLGVPLTTYANYEQGNTEPNCERLKKLSALYGVSINQLLGDESDANIIISKRKFRELRQAEELIRGILASAHVQETRPIRQRETESKKEGKE